MVIQTETLMKQFNETDRAEIEKKRTIFSCTLSGVGTRAY